MLFSKKTKVQKSVVLLAMTLLTGMQACAPARKSPSNLVETLLQSRPDWFGTILADPAKYEVQVLYTQIDRDARNQPRFSSHAYRLNRDQYFYPASAIKFPAAVLALEKLNELNVPGLARDTPLRIDSAFHKQLAEETDPTSANGLPSLGHYIKKLLVVSDNDAYNRCYEFVGQEYLNDRLRAKGFADSRIVHRLSVGDDAETARHTNPFTFYDAATRQTIYHQPQAVSRKTYPMPVPHAQTQRGKGYMSYRQNPQGELINKPMDFSGMNYVSVEALQAMLRSVMLPQAVPDSARFRLTQADYQFLYRYLSIYPKESRYPTYADTCCNQDGYCKFLMYGDTKADIPPNIRIFNKVGNAYGYLIDNAYIVDFDRGIEFLLTAVIYVNQDGIFNDNKYEYDEVGLPFMARLGQVVYAHETKRPRRYRPNLEQYRVRYE
jgi:beta-lactamase class A